MSTDHDRDALLIYAGRLLEPDGPLTADVRVRAEALLRRATRDGRCSFRDVLRAYEAPGAAS